MRLVSPLQAVSLAIAITVSAQPAKAYDMDCAVILCMSGGFPGAACKPPLAYMIKRITPFPSRPPFGVCSMVGKGGVTTPLRPKDYPWLDRIRVFMWTYAVYQTQDEHFPHYRWQLKSCDADQNCKPLSSGHGGSVAPPSHIITENGQKIEMPTRFNRAVSIEHSDFEGNMSFSGWTKY